MASRTVRVGARYTYHAVGMDAWERNPYRPAEGEVVTVVNLPGCPRANTMGHCYVQNDNVGPVLVLTNSLVPVV